MAMDKSNDRMGDNDEPKDSLETTASTPDSTAAAGSGLKASKDRNCPFCDQAFTSSSLGRHLDLYIKPNNPKAPDGVHDVEEILKLRGGITRRQPRTSLKADTSAESEKRGDSNDLASRSASKVAEPEKESKSNSPSLGLRKAKDGYMHTYFNAANWQATGVINDLPPRVPSRRSERSPAGQAERMREMRRDAVGDRIERPEYTTEDTWKLQEEAEVGRAAEMALREVLGSLEAARRKVEPPGLFEDFDFCSLTFPELCLAILPPPPTLFSSNPFPLAHTWTLSPPGEQQRTTVVRMLHERIAAARNGSLQNFPESVAFRHRVHVDGAYENWQTLSETEQAITWNLETSRAFVRERNKKQQLKTELETAEQRIRHLEAEYDRLSRCQLPRDYLLHPPNTVPMASAVAREISSSKLHSGVQEVDYDADALLYKWKAAVKATARPARPSGQPVTQPHYVEESRNQLKEDMVLNGSIFGINGPLPRYTDARGQPTIMYETPQNPGAVVDDDTSPEEVAGSYANAGIEMDEPEPNQCQMYDYALARLRRPPRQMSKDTPDGILNAHGKRPLGPSAVNGRGSGPKVYKEHSK